VNLDLYSRVLWRFRALMLAGLGLALLLSVFSYAKLEFHGGLPHLVPRKAEIFSAQARLFVTTPGFPWGNAQEKFVDTGGSPSAVGDPGRLTSVATLYAQLATSDVVRRGALARSKVKGKISAQVESTQIGTLLPVIDVQAAAPSASGSMKLAEAAANAFQAWVTKQQAAAHIPDSQRVIVQMIARPAKPTVLVPRKATLSIVLFLIVLMVFTAAAFVLDNLRPEPRTFLARSGAVDPLDELKRAA